MPTTYFGEMIPGDLGRSFRSISPGPVAGPPTSLLTGLRRDVRVSRRFGSGLSSSGFETPCFDLGFEVGALRRSVRARPLSTWIQQNERCPESH